MDVDKFPQIRLTSKEKRALRALAKRQTMPIADIGDAHEILLSLQFILDIAGGSDDQGFPILTGECEITDVGKLYFQYATDDVRRFRIPIIISLCALAISLIALLVSILTMLGILPLQPPL